MRVYLGIALLLALAFGFDWFPHEIKLPPGVLVVDEPEQNLIARAKPWRYKEETGYHKQALINW